MLTTLEPRPKGRRFSLTDQAHAVAVILQEEFGVPFRFYDAVTGQMVHDPDESVAGAESSKPRFLQDTGASKTQPRPPVRASVSVLPAGGFQLVLPIYESGEPVLVAIGVLPALTKTPSDMAQEQARLQKWLQTVCERLRATNQVVSRRAGAWSPDQAKIPNSKFQIPNSKPEVGIWDLRFGISTDARRGQESRAQVVVAWETLLTLDQLMRRVRVHKEPARSQKRILQAAAELVQVGSLIWVPPEVGRIANPSPTDETTQIVGDPCLSPWDCRQLAAQLAQTQDWQESGFLLCNQVSATDWGQRFPQIANLLAFPVLDQSAPGWVIAVNKEGSGVRSQGCQSRDRQGAVEGPLPVGRGSDIQPPTPGFRRTDAALLTPFVGLLGLQVRGSARYCRVKDLLVGLTRSLTAAIDAKDSYTAGHSERVARVAVELGRELQLKEDELSDIYLAGLLHDIGKIGIRDTVLCKPGRLTAQEFDHIKEHVTIGYKILADLTPIHHLLPGVLYHHEHVDGRGYPDGLKGEAIPFLARILAVADGYDAMSTVRPYREAMPLDRVEEILTQGAGIQWDKQVVEALMRCRHKVRVIRQRGVGESLRQALDGALRYKDKQLKKGSSCASSTP